MWKRLGWGLLIAAVAGCGLAALIRWRGLRATAQPSAEETVAARWVRDFAIPSAEKRRVNPLPASPAVVLQGREAFDTSCAGCHGVDGSGRTPMGLNLYPRVPDLRAPATQALTDGQLHYFIVNGVQLTGMPAWHDPEPGSTEGSWKIVAYLRRLAHPSASVQAAGVAGAHYVGSQACASCHRDIYQRWIKTPMANIVRDPRTHPDAIIPNPASDHIAPFQVSQVALVYGSIWKQRYFTKVGNEYYPLPVQWEVGAKKWSRYVVPSSGGDWWAQYYPADNMQRPTGTTCDGCHSVGYNIQTKTVAEWNVGCERCHGPGSAHAAHPSAANIVNPAAMDPVAANDTCIQCHSQGRPLSIPLNGKYYDWPVGYQLGSRLQDSWQLETCHLGQTDFYYFADCTAHKNRMQGNDFAQSVMYQHGITCFSCHDVHGTQNHSQLIKPENQICLDCHGPNSPNGPHEATIAAHTHHAQGSPGSQCIACHMPQIETEGVPGAYVHAHTFRFISPSLTDQYKIPNPCTSCHAGKTTAWAEKALAQWPERSPWTVR
jgi:predicted CXXCH cytochrome family protein